jgi:excisionase family DNA binding protein
MGEQLLLTPAEAAAMLAIPKSRLLAIVRGGGIACVRFGPRTVRIPPSEVERVANSWRDEPEPRRALQARDRRPPPVTQPAPGRRRRRQTGPPQPLRRVDRYGRDVG